MPFRIDPPSVDAVVGPRGAEMRVAAPILDPAEEERGPVRKTRRSRIEHRVRRIGPVGGGQNRIARVPSKQHLVSGSGRHVVSWQASAGAGRLSVRYAPRMSHKANRKEMVASAPWLRLTRSAWSPSRQPPVAGS